MTVMVTVILIVMVMVVVIFAMMVAILVAVMLVMLLTVVAVVMVVVAMVEVKEVMAMTAIVAIVAMMAMMVVTMAMTTAMANRKDPLQFLPVLGGVCVDGIAKSTARARTSTDELGIYPVPVQTDSTVIQCRTAYHTTARQCALAPALD